MHFVACIVFLCKMDARAGLKTLQNGRIGQRNTGFEAAYGQKPKGIRRFGLLLSVLTVWGTH